MARNASTTHGVTRAAGSLNAIASSASRPLLPASAESCGEPPAATTRRNFISVTIIIDQLMIAEMVAMLIR